MQNQHCVTTVIEISRHVYQPPRLEPQAKWTQVVGLSLPFNPNSFEVDAFDSDNQGEDF